MTAARAERVAGEARRCMAPGRGPRPSPSSSRRGSWMGRHYFDELGEDRSRAKRQISLSRESRGEIFSSLFSLSLQKKTDKQRRANSRPRAASASYEAPLVRPNEAHGVPHACDSRACIRARALVWRAYVSTDAQGRQTVTARGYRVTHAGAMRLPRSLRGGYACARGNRSAPPLCPLHVVGINTLGWSH